jgi:hypothetical protein
MIRASQRGGQRGQFAPVPQLKNPKICKRGATKGVIKNILLGTFFYINSGMRKIF